MIDNPNNDFNNSTNTFTAPETGLYRIVMTITGTAKTTPSERESRIYVFGLVSEAENKWVARFSVPKDGFLVSGNSNAGYANTFLSIVRLEANKKYYFGRATPADISLLAKPSGTSGTGIGTYF